MAGRRSQPARNAKKTTANQPTGETNDGVIQAPSVSAFGLELASGQQIIHLSEIPGLSQADARRNLAHPIFLSNDPETTRRVGRLLAPSSGDVNDDYAFKWNVKFGNAGMNLFYKCSGKGKYTKGATGQCVCCSSANCACSREDGGDDSNNECPCILRNDSDERVKFECNHKDLCSNSDVRCNTMPLTYLCYVEGFGLGLFACEKIAAGTFIGVFAGEVCIDGIHAYNDYSLELKRFHGMITPSDLSTYVKKTGDFVDEGQLKLTQAALQKSASSMKLFLRPATRRGGGNHTMFMNSPLDLESGNIEIVHVHGCGQFFPSVYATKDIDQHEQLLFYYAGSQGHEYTRQPPKYDVSRARKYSNADPRPFDKIGSSHLWPRAERFTTNGQTYCVTWGSMYRLLSAGDYNQLAVHALVEQAERSTATAYWSRDLCVRMMYSTLARLGLHRWDDDETLTSDIATTVRHISRVTTLFRKMRHVHVAPEVRFEVPPLSHALWLPVNGDDLRSIALINSTGIIIGTSSSSSSGGPRDPRQCDRESSDAGKLDTVIVVGLVGTDFTTWSSPSFHILHMLAHLPKDKFQVVVVDVTPPPSDSSGLSSGCPSCWSVNLATALADKYVPLGKEVAQLTGERNSAYWTIHEILQEERLDILLFSVHPLECPAVFRVISENRESVCRRRGIVLHGQASWTHVSSQLSTVNYYVSTEAIMPASSASVCTEQVVHMPETYITTCHAHKLPHLQHALILEKGNGTEFDCIVNSATRVFGDLESCSSFILATAGNPRGPTECHVNGAQIINGHLLSSVFRIDPSTCAHSIPPTAMILTTRAHHSLPPDGPIIAYFANPLNPDLLRVCLEVLSKIKNATLWLTMDGAQRTRRLSLNAMMTAVGLSSSRRVVFAPPVGHEEHVRRLQLATLAVQSAWPCNSEATTLDFLFANVPVLCVPFVESSNGYFATHLLSTLNMDSLLVPIEKLADGVVTLLQNPDHLAEIKRTLKRNIAQSLAFNPQVYAHYFADLLTQIDGGDCIMAPVVTVSPEVNKTTGWLVPEIASVESSVSNINKSASTERSSEKSSSATPRREFNCELIPPSTLVNESAFKRWLEGSPFGEECSLTQFTSLLHLEKMIGKILAGLREQLGGTTEDDETVSFPLGPLVVDYFLHVLSCALQKEGFPKIVGGNDPDVVEQVKAMLMVDCGRRQFVRTQAYFAVVTTSDDSKVDTEITFPVTADESRASPEQIIATQQDVNCPFCDNARVGYVDFLTTHHLKHTLKASEPGIMALLKCSPRDCGEVVTGHDSDHHCTHDVQRMWNVESVVSNHRGDSSINNNGDWPTRLASYKSNPAEHSRIFHDGQDIVTYHWLEKMALVVLDSIWSEPTQVPIDGSLLSIFAHLLKLQTRITTLPVLPVCMNQRSSSSGVAATVLRSFMTKPPVGLATPSRGLLLYDVFQVEQFLEDTMMRRDVNDVRRTLCACHDRVCGICSVHVDELTLTDHHRRQHTLITGSQHQDLASSRSRCSKCKLPTHDDGAMLMAHSLLHQN